MSLTIIEINKANLLYNLAQFKKIAPNSEIWPVIKSNAYGHGLKEVAEILDKDPNASGFMVVSLEEAIYLLDLVSKPIMVLSFFERDDEVLTLAATKKVSLPLYDLDTAQYLDDLAKKINNKFLVNIKIDTGTSRLGFKTKDAHEAIRQIKSKANLEINSIFTHYAESESEDLSFSKKQLEEFKKITASFPGIRVHSACSAASISLKEAQGDLIRLGVSLYGLWPSEAASSRAKELGVDIRPVLSLKTKVIQIKNLSKGETIGYNRSYKTDKDIKLAVIPVGYFDGYSRLFSNKAKVLIQGKEYNIRGNICMNLSMIELPYDSQLKVGETVVLLGQDNGLEISADYLAGLSQTINYEVVTKLNPNIKRLVL